MKRWFLSVILIGILMVTGMMGTGTTLRGVASSPSTGNEFIASLADRKALEEAVYAAIRRDESETLAYLLFQPRVIQTRFSPEGEWAAALLGLTDPNGEALPSEPGWAIARRSGENWVVTLPSDPGWITLLQAAPAALFSVAERNEWQGTYQESKALRPEATFSGYRLPWAYGETKYLSQSVSHDRYDASLKAHYAFDFYVSGQMWEIRAAKGGTVWLMKEDVPTCYDPTCADTQALGNYIILKDISTTPVTYQLYLHLKQDSIPSNLHIGDQVVRGQFIGVADNTGQSYGHHLHFMVHTTPGSYWGTSVDITFEDVPINGGRPRRHDATYDDWPWCRDDAPYYDVCDIGQASYVSQNDYLGDFTPPGGDFSGIALGQEVTTRTVSLSGWGADDLAGLATAQFVVKTGSDWVPFGPVFTASPFTYEWDLCATEIPDGLVSVGLRLADTAGNVNAATAVRSFSKDYACSPVPPACQPGPEQVAVFEEPGFASCALFSVGDYANVGAVGNDDASSIAVGANVQATLYANADFTGRAETFWYEDENLADNLIGPNTASALRVVPRSQAAAVPRLVSPAEGTSLAPWDVAALYWENAGESDEFQARLTRNLTLTITSTWQVEPFWRLAGLDPGDYTWQVRARNAQGASAWSTAGSFNVFLGAPPQPPLVTAPYSDGMESNRERWTATGLWRAVNDGALAHAGSYSWWYQESDDDYDTGAANQGTLASPRIEIPASGHYYLRFYYRYTTESQDHLWDQRWVQIAVDGGPFQDAWQLGDDPVSSEFTSSPWLASKALDLGGYNGHILQVRFAFDTLDDQRNAFEGWALDDVSINTTAPAVCSDSREPNDTWQQASPIASGGTASAVICPGGDFDYYAFSGVAGETVVADIDAKSLGSALDPYLLLLDSDGVSILAQNDDEVYSTQQDSFIRFVLPHEGTYYLKVRAWKNPAVGGSTYTYTLRFYSDGVDPVLDFPSPANAFGFLPNAAFTLSAQVTDAGSGVDRVEFRWHTNDWLNSDWVLLGTDTNGSNGWTAPFDPSAYPDQLGAALYVTAYDRARNIVGNGYWNLGLDRTPPLSALFTLPVTQTRTAFPVNWSGNDALAGLDHYDLQWTLDEGGNWQAYTDTLGSSASQAWFIGSAGQEYGFRLRAVDRAANTETWPATPEVTTTIPGPEIYCASPDEWDRESSDNTVISATLILTGALQTHNFCNPLRSDGLYDEDWVQFTVQAGGRYLVLGIPQDSSTAVSLELYAGDGLTLLAEFTPDAFGQASALSWLATEDGNLYLRLRHRDGRVAGQAVSYRLWFGEGYQTLLPLVKR